MLSDNRYGIHWVNGNDHGGGKKATPKPQPTPKSETKPEKTGKAQSVSEK